MNEINSVWVFVVNVNGDEKIVLWPNEIGTNLMLVYTSKEDVMKDNMRVAIQELADKSKLYFELREYKVVSETVERFYPSKSQYNA